MPKARKGKKKSEETQRNRVDSSEDAQNRSSQGCDECNESTNLADPAEPGPSQEDNKPYTSTKRGQKRKTSPRKISKGKRKCRGEANGDAVASFVEDDHVIVMRTSERENGEFGDEENSQNSTQTNEDGIENPEQDPSETASEGMIEDSSSSSSESEDEEVLLPVQKAAVDVNKLERQLAKVNARMLKMQRLMEKNEYAGPSRSKTRSRSRSRTPRRRRSRTRSRSRNRSRSRRSRSRSGTPRNHGERNRGGKRKIFHAPLVTVTSPSESTIYNPAVLPNIRNSSSSDEGMGIFNSDEEQPMTVEAIDHNNSFSHSQFAGQQERARTTVPVNRNQSEVTQQRRPVSTQQTPEEKAENMIREAEAAKIRMLEVAGKTRGKGDLEPDLREFSHTAMMDENFLLVAAHIEESTRKRIEQGGYVDFARLLPNDRVFAEHDSRMEWIQEEGRTFLAPAGYRNRDRNGITSFSKWEQAFRVYSDIYSRANPEKAVELIQYNHIIGTAAMSYIWDNVYLYDCHFRVHMSRNPSRS